MTIIHTPIVRFITVVGIAATAVLAAAGCGSPAPSAAASGPGPELRHITVGTLPVTDSAPLFIAIKKGYFKQQGLSVTTKILAQSTAAIPSMKAGTIDIMGSGNYVSFFDAEASGVIKLKVLAAASACSTSTLNVLARPGSKISSPAGLAGKTIAVNLTSNIQTLTINAVLRLSGVNPARIKYVVIPFADMPAALAAGRVDAISEVEPFITTAEDEDGATSVLSECEGPTATFPLSGYYATQSWVQRYPRTAKAFQRAIEKAAAAADNDPQLAREVIPAYTQISAGTAALISLPEYPIVLDVAQMQRVASLMESAHLLRKPLNVASILFDPVSS